MLHPLVLGLGLVAERPGFEQRHFEPGVMEQVHDLARRVFAIMARLRLLALHARANVGGEKSRMIARQNRRDRAQRTDIGRGQHQVSAGPQDPVDLRHHVHRIFRQMLHQLAAQHRGEIAVVVRKAVLLRIK